MNKTQEQALRDAEKAAINHVTQMRNRTELIEEADRYLVRTPTHTWKFPFDPPLPIPAKNVLVWVWDKGGDVKLPKVSTGELSRKGHLLCSTGIPQNATSFSPWKYWERVVQGPE